ncbi:MAG: hypothetical protein ACK5AW_17165 [Pseudanabaena sp.]
MTIIILVNFKLFKIVRYPVMRSPLTPHKPRSPFPNIKQRSSLIHPSNPIVPQHQPAIASYHPINAISYFSINQRSFVRSATKGIILENIKTNT